MGPVAIVVDSRSFSQLIPDGPEELTFELERMWDEGSPSESSDRVDVFFHAYDEAHIFCAFVDDATRCAVIRTTWTGEHAATCSTTYRVAADGRVTLRRTGRDPHCPPSRTIALDALLVERSARLPSLFDEH